MALSSSSAAAISASPLRPSSSSVKVCVVGGGVGGCAAVVSLLSPNNDNKAIPTVSLLEMGRGVGGRASTRFSRDDARIAINHGAPHAEIKTEGGSSLMRELEKRGFAKHLNPQSKATAATGQQPEYWTGKPNMNSLCEGLLDSLHNKPQCLFKSMVRSVEPIMTPTDAFSVDGWLLKDKDGTILVKTKWLIVAGSGIAHPRWSTTFGGEPPLVAASKTLYNEALDNALECIGKVQSRPVQVAMMAFEVQQNDSLICKSSSTVVRETPGNGILEKMVLQRSDDGTLFSIVAHSTAKFAEVAKDTYGSKSSAALIGGVTSNAEREQEILDLLVGAVRQNLTADEEAMMEKPVYGPFLHRWGNAFPEGVSLPLESAVVEDAKIAFCGDYVGDQNRFGSFEGALMSGTSVGEQVRQLLLSDSK